MAISVQETYGVQMSGTRTPSEREKRFKVRGTADEDAAYAALSAHVYTNVPRLGALIVKSVALDEGVAGASLWEGTATYGKRDPQTLRGERPEISFSTRGGTAKTTHSLRTVQAVARPEPTYQSRWVAPDGEATAWADVATEQATASREQWYADLGFHREERVKTETSTDAQGRVTTRLVTTPGRPLNFHNGINFDQGTFQGCERVVPALSCHVALAVPNDRMNASYQRLLLRLTGTVNSRPFLGFRAGEWLFMGADARCRYEDAGMTGSDEPQLVWDLTYEFRGSPNVTNQYLAGLGPFAKRGHDFVWAYSEKRESTVDDGLHGPVGGADEGDPADAASEPVFAAEGRSLVAPRCVYVEQVYDYRDFTALGLQF